MDGLGSASPPVAPTATTGEGRHPCTWPRTFWFKPLSAFGLLDLTTFISSSPELAMPSTLAPNRLSASSRRALSREARPPWVGEVTLSQELRTARLPRPHVLVGYQWSHTGLRPGRKTSHNRYIRSFVSHPPQIRTCTSMHPVPHLRTSLRRSAGRGPHGPGEDGNARSDRFWLLELRVSRTFLDNLRLICSVHGYPARRAASTADPDNSPLAP